MFDLKGSLVNREVKNPSPGDTLKDINLLSVKLKENVCKFSKADREFIMNKIKGDAQVLMKHNIMDYSLLLAIEENILFNPPKAGSTGNPTNPSQHSGELIPLEEEEFFSSRHIFLSSNRQYIYHIAIIDYLQDYNGGKKQEHFFKTIWRGKDAEISAVPPKRYEKRYVDFMDQEVFLNDQERIQKSKTMSRNTLSEGNRELN